MIIRDATPADFPAIADLHARSWQSAYRNQLPDSYLDDEVPAELATQWQACRPGPRDVLLVAENQDGLAGFAATWCQPDPYLDNLHVDPDRRSAGLGRQLMQASAARLRSHGFTSVYLWVFEGNDRALAFYERLGGKVMESQLHDLAGHKVPCLRVHWADLSLLIGESENG